MPTLESVVHSDPEILGGTPVFAGTRVPIKNLLDYLAAGDMLGEGSRPTFRPSAAGRRWQRGAGIAEFGLLTVSVRVLLDRIASRDAWRSRWRPWSQNGGPRSVGEAAGTESCCTATSRATASSTVRRSRRDRVCSSASARARSGPVATPYGCGPHVLVVAV